MNNKVPTKEKYAQLLQHNRCSNGEGKVYCEVWIDGDLTRQFFDPSDLLKSKLHLQFKKSDLNTIKRWAEHNQQVRRDTSTRE